jgi:hypothetical protein
MRGADMVHDGKSRPEKNNERCDRDDEENIHFEKDTKRYRVRAFFRLRESGDGEAQRWFR